MTIFRCFPEYRDITGTDFRQCPRAFAFSRRFSHGPHFAFPRTDMKTPLATTATVVKTLGHRGRLRILSLLAHGETSVCQMAAALKMPVSTMSGLLLELRTGGLVREERRGKWVFYTLLDDAQARGLLEVILAQVQTDPQVRRDAAAAEKLRAKAPGIACAAVGVTHGAKGKR